MVLGASERLSGRFPGYRFTLRTALEGRSVDPGALLEALEALPETETARMSLNDPYGKT